MKLTPLLRAGARAIIILSVCTLALPARARVGETEAQMLTRYGAPKSDTTGPNEQPLLAGARELSYVQEGWRIRAAFLNGSAVRLEYIKIPDAGGLKKLTDDEVQAILQAEKGTYSWREQKPRTGFDGLNKLQTALEGRTWERSDHVTFKFKSGVVVVVETREADAWEKKQAKQPSKATPAATNVPKF